MNILVVICDQLSAQALPSWGNAFACTPHIDRLLAEGTRFADAYTNCPLCMPSRASFWTSRYPHQTRVESNGRNWPVTDVDASVPTLGETFRRAGYRTVHFGKEHDAGTLRGFDRVPGAPVDLAAEHALFPVHNDTRLDADTRAKAVEFLRGYAGDAPYLAVCDFNNPHNICQWIGEFQNNAQIPQHDFPLPPPPANLHLSDAEWRARPLPVQYICCAHNRQSQMAEWDEDRIRHYLLAYHHYLSRADADVGAVLAAMESRPDAGDTLVVFFADHGDSLCGRWMGTKHTSFYEETTHVPWAFRGPGVPAGASVPGVVSLLDLFPTLCDLARIAVPSGVEGVSLVPWILGDATGRAHDYVVAEWHTEWGFTVEPGRLVHSGRHKYMRYREGGGEEFYDLEADPGETRNAVLDPDHAGQVELHRRWLREALSASGDPFETLPWHAAARWRAHPSGPRHHRGPAAPMVGPG